MLRCLAKKTKFDCSEGLYKLEINYNIQIESNTDLTNYDFKVIATPKDKTYEDMSKEELIKLLKSKE